MRLLYGYYDCENLVNFRKGRTAHNPLGNLSREEIEEQTKNPDRLPARMATVVRSYSAIVDEDADNEDGIDTDRSFENALFSAYYDECAHSKSRFLRQWADFDRNLRNISAAVVARVTGRSAEQSVVGGDETSQQLKRSSAADFGLRGDVPYLEAVIAAVNDETNLVEKERQDRRDPLEPGRGAFHFRLFRHQRAAGLPGEGEHRGALDPFGRQAGARNAAPPDDQSGRQGFDQ